MNVAYFGNDWHIGCVDVFKQNGHTISHIFINGEKAFNHKIRQYAAKNNIQVIYTVELSNKDAIHLQKDFESNTDNICFDRFVINRISSGFNLRKCR